MNAIFFRLFPFLFIVFTSLIFFYPTWLEGKVALPGDLIVGSYYPWIDNGLKAVKNPITSDAISFSYPMQTLAWEKIMRGEWPLWNERILMGTPLLANFQSSPFSLTRISYLLFDTLTAWNIQIILQHILAGIFTYLLASYLGIGAWGSLMASLVFSFSGFMVIWSEWNIHSLTAAFFPLIFLSSLKYLKGGDQKILIFLALSFAFQIFTGYPQILLYQMMTVVFFLIIVKARLFRKILVIAAFVLGAGIACLQLLPGFELLGLSQRSVEVIPDEWIFLSFAKVITLVAPDFFGNHSTYNFWGTGNYTLHGGFVGSVTLFLAIYGYITSKSLLGARLSLLLICISLIVSFKNPLSEFLLNLPYLSLKAATAHRSLVLFDLGIAIGAGFGLDAIIKKGINLKKMMVSAAFPAMLIFGFGLISILEFNGFVKVFNASKENLLVGMRNLIFPFAILTSGIIVLKFRKRNILAGLLICIVFFDLLRFFVKYTPFSLRTDIFPQNEVIDYLKRQEQPFRVVSKGVVPTNSLMSYGLSTIDGYDAVYPLNVSKYLAVANSDDYEVAPQDRYGKIDNIYSPLVDLASGKYVLMLKKGIGQGVSGFEKVYEKDSVVVLQNRKALESVRFFNEWEVLDNEKEVLVKLLSDNSKLYLTVDPELERGGELKRLSYDNKKQEVGFSGGPGLLFLANTWYPGWEAWVDGKGVDVYKSNYNFLAIPIREKGEHIVNIMYRPLSFTVGLLISGFCIIILFTWSLVYLLMRVWRKYT